MSSKIHDFYGSLLKMLSTSDSLYFQVLILINCVVGISCCEENLRSGYYSNTKLESALNSPNLVRLTTVTAVLIVLVTIRSTMEAVDVNELEVYFKNTSVALDDAVIFNGILSISICAPTLCLFLEGTRKVAYYVFFDSCKIFNILGGLFIVCSNRGISSSITKALYAVLLVSQILFYMGTVVIPSIKQIRLSDISAILFITGFGSIFVREYILDFRRTYDKFRSGEFFVFNSVDNITFCFFVYVIVTYSINWMLKLYYESYGGMNSGDFHYFNMNEFAMSVFQLPVLMIQLIVLSTPKRMDEKMKKLLEDFITNTLNQKEELESLSKKYVKVKRKNEKLLREILPLSGYNSHFMHSLCLFLYFL